MNTRAFNAMKCPGQVIINSGTCHTKKIVEAEHTFKAMEKEKIAVMEKKGIEKVVRIESNARKKKNLGP